MNHFKSGLQIAGVSAMVFALVACQNTQTPESTGVSPEIKEGVVFSEKFADEGLFTIEKSADGGYNYSVGARIGSEAEKRVASSMDVPTLVGVYQHINDGKAEIPAIVGEASQWLASRPSSGVEKTKPAPAPLQKEAAESDFRNGYCKNFVEGNYVWKPMTCYWKANSNYMGTGGVNSFPDANDRVWFWNATSRTGSLRLMNTANTALASTWQPYINPYWVTWFQWGGSYTNANASIKLDGTFAGELGVSNSSRFYRW
jgi:hypothetical protein